MKWSMCFLVLVSTALLSPVGAMAQNEGDSLAEAKKADAKKADAKKKDPRKAFHEAMKARMLKQFDKNGDGKIDDEERKAIHKQFEERRAQWMKGRRPGGDKGKPQFGKRPSPWSRGPQRGHSFHRGPRGPHGHHARHHRGHHGHRGMHGHRSRYGHHAHRGHHGPPRHHGHHARRGHFGPQRGGPWGRPGSRGPSRYSFRGPQRPGQFGPPRRPSGGPPAGGSFMIKLLDKNKDGKISEEEFLAKLRERFQKADANNDGSISGDEIKKMIPGPPRRGLGPPGKKPAAPGKKKAPAKPKAKKPAAKKAEADTKTEKK